METTAGERFARALGAKDAPALRELLAPQVDFRALTPGRSWEASSATEVIDDVFFGHWFEPTDHIVAVEAIEHDTVVDRERVGYRFRVTNDEGTFIVEQQAYLGVTDDAIDWLRIMCCGYQRVE
jgi:hypothetical protein